MLYGAFLSILLLLLIYPLSFKDYLAHNFTPLITILCTGLIFSIYIIIQLGFHSGIRYLLTFPYPNWIVLNSISPGITFLFLALIIYLASSVKNFSNNTAIIFTIIALFPIVIVGLFMKWAPARYIIAAYPFVLLSSSFTLFSVIEFICHRLSINDSKIAIFTSCLICLFGLLGGHGLLQAYKAGTLDYGTKLNIDVLEYPFYPDHKNPGKFVKNHRKPDDIVIAEDAHEQIWYAGSINYWLRNYINDIQYMYKAKDNKLHDIYIDSIVATPDVLLSLDNKHQRTWIITSGEVLYNRKYYLSDEQRLWLSNIERNNSPVYIGKDGLTRVYCLNCK